MSTTKKKQSKAKTGTIDPPSLSERMVRAAEMIAREMRRANDYNQRQNVVIDLREVRPSQRAR